MSVDSRIVATNKYFDTALTLTASSSDADFPVANLRSFTRAKLWRATGNFVINSTNNKINLKDSGGGSELTATLASATYTPTTLAAEIKSKIEAVSAHTYTVTFSTTTGKWTIATNHSFLSLLANTGTNVATSVWTTIGFTTASDKTGATTYTGTNVALHTEEWILLDLGSAQAMDSFAILIDPLMGSQLSGSAVVTLQANATDAWTSPSVSQVLTYDSNYTIYTHYFTSNQSYRYWRIKIVDPNNTSLKTEIHKAFLGKKIALTRIPEIGFKYSLKSQSKKESTAYGHQYYDIYPIKRFIDFDLTFFEDADLQLLEQTYRLNQCHTPVLFCMDSQDEVLDKDQFTIYGYMKADLTFEHRIIDRFSSQMSIEEGF